MAASLTCKVRAISRFDCLFVFSTRSVTISSGVSCLGIGLALAGGFGSLPASVPRCRVAYFTPPVHLRNTSCPLTLIITCPLTHGDQPGGSGVAEPQGAG